MMVSVRHYLRLARCVTAATWQLFNTRLLFASAPVQPDWGTIIFASLHLGEACFHLSVMTHKRNKNGRVQVIMYACVLRRFVSVIQKSRKMNLKE